MSKAPDDFSDKAQLSQLMRQITQHACNNTGIDSTPQKVPFRKVPMIVFTYLLYLSQDLQNIQNRHGIYLAL